MQRHHRQPPTEKSRRRRRRKRRKGRLLLKITLTLSHRTTVHRQKQTLPHNSAETVALFKTLRQNLHVRGAQRSWLCLIGRFTAQSFPRRKFAERSTSSRPPRTRRETQTDGASMAYVQASPPLKSESASTYELHM